MMDSHWWKLYDKYGERNVDGYYIDDHEKWHYFAQRPKLYKRRKLMAWCCLLIPIAGVIGTEAFFSEMGLSIW